MAGIKDVAEKAGVSVTTVSRVLNKRGYISQEMYQRVNQAIEELNYYPNQIARYLYWQRTFVIGLLIPDVSRPFFACLAKYIEMELSSRGYKMLLCNTEEKANKERECLAMLRQNKVDGIVIGSHALDTSEYRKVVLPMVSIDMKLGDQIPNVSSNHRRGGELAARKLIENGCKNVVQIMSDRRIKTNSQERHKAFQRLMEENGIKCTTYELKKQGSICEEYAKAEKKIFSVASGVDGAFAIDYIAARILRAALSRGIRVPQELKIVGYDGTEIAELVYPRLTTVCQNYAALSQSIVSSLVYQIEQKERPEVDPIHDVVLFEGGTTLA
ncbi:MAG: LacI family DNA-binding transcriptional regulator [Faecalispora sporosphaeroides]|uniref:LacI family transcriptional regulator n=1 Tax=Faecalispora sporosphaeroides TaxID=1549 RepID=A0A928KVD6_9FIRM|nr:LacI family DNA-binding transcriptional regulator [Faecalispora sporosphaeroides]MBE6832329.1 LacI family transcriptional regulator [Faecalispora sporosphaeroides]